MKMFVCEHLVVGQQPVQQLLIPTSCPDMKVLCSHLHHHGGSWRLCHHICPPPPSAVVGTLLLGWGPAFVTFCVEVWREDLPVLVEPDWSSRTLF